MPAPCPRCSTLLPLNALRCRSCGADARAASGPPMLGPGDLLAYRDLRSWARENAPRTFRRATILDRIDELAPDFLSWLRRPIETRGPAPALSREAEEEITELLAEYEGL